MPLLPQNCDAAIPASIKQDCLEGIGQIPYIAIQGQQAGGAAYFDGTIGKDITVAADWLTAISAVDGTKIWWSPALEGFTIGEGNSIMEGGNSNDTQSGYPRVLGREFQEGGAAVAGAGKDVIQSMEDVMEFVRSKVKGTYATIYFIEEGTTSTYVHAFETATDSYKGFNLPTGNRHGTNQPDAFSGTSKTPLMFVLEDGWDQGKTKVKTAFDATTDIYSTL